MSIFRGRPRARDWLLAAFWLVRRVESPRFSKVETLGPRIWLYYFRIRDESDIDDEMMASIACWSASSGNYAAQTDTAARSTSRRSVSSLGCPTTTATSTNRTCSLTIPLLIRTGIC
jgi:hypothetical protein